MKGGWLVI